MSYITPLWFAKHRTNISHHFKLTKTRFYHQQLWNAVIYCYLLCIFEFYDVFMDIFIILHIEECGS